MARTHFISNQLISPIVLAKSTATCPKTMRYRSGFMRIVTAASDRLLDVSVLAHSGGRLRHARYAYPAGEEGVHEGFFEFLLRSTDSRQCVD